MKRQILLALAVILLAAPSVEADQYKVPSQDLVDMYLAPPVPKAQFNKEASLAVISYRSCAFRDISEMAEVDEYCLGGLVINGRNFSQSRVKFTLADSLAVLIPRKGSQKPVALPAGAKVDDIKWSPDGKKFAFINRTATEMELYLVDATASKPKAKKINEFRLNTVLGECYCFLPDGSILYKSVPEFIGAVPNTAVPKGPIEMKSRNRKSEYKTYRNLLQNPGDETLYRYFCNSQFAIYDGHRTKRIGMPDIYRDFKVSPDGKYILVTTEEEPFSFSFQHNRFFYKVWIMDIEGSAINVLREPKKRFKFTRSQFQWRSDYESSIVYLQTEKSDDKKKKDADGDDDDKDDETVKEEPIYTTSLWQLDYPFKITVKNYKHLLARAKFPIKKFWWGDENLALYTMTSKNEKMTYLMAYNPSDTTFNHEILYTESTARDTVGDKPVFGTPYTKAVSGGSRVLFLEGDAAILLTGKDRPDANGDEMAFVDRLDLRSKEITNVWTAKAPYADQIVKINGEKKGKASIIIRRESNKIYPNYYQIDTKDGNENKNRQLTFFENPLPQINDIQDTFITYYREDSLKCTGRLYLPADYIPERDGRLPLFMWTYPYEYRTKAEAEKYRQARYTFPIPGRANPVGWATKGYAVLVGWSMAILSETPERQPNDRFISELKMSAKAAIDHLDSIGIADRSRIAVGGHSYGSFMTANLMCHTDWFKAGLAESGAFNRSMTPWGFQHEKRSYWKAMKMYNEMSPFNYADKLKGHILFVHGMMDENTGTHPLQSERMYYAVAGNGGDAEYLQLPYEWHSYIFKENALHLFAKTYEMLEKYVKGVDQQKKEEDVER